MGHLTSLPAWPLPQAPQLDRMAKMTIWIWTMTTTISSRAWSPMVQGARILLIQQRLRRARHLAVKLLFRSASEQVNRRHSRSVIMCKEVFSMGSIQLMLYSLALECILRALLPFIAVVNLSRLQCRSLHNASCSYTRLRFRSGAGLFVLLGLVAVVFAI